MSTLLLRLAAPMQSWGTQSRYEVRDTGTEPSKSGVIGLLCAALGRGRNIPVDDLASLRMGVRVDREGVVKMDFQTAGGGDFAGRSSYGVYRADGSRPGAVLAHKYYLSDADFLVGLEADGQDALTTYEWPRFDLEVPSPRVRPDELRLVLETEANDGEDMRSDQPVGAAFVQRRFAVRYVTTRFLSLGADVPIRSEAE